MEKEITKIFDIKKDIEGITPKKRKYNPCTHKKSLLVDEKNRCLECGECGQVIDPYDYVLQVANRTRYLLDIRKDLRKEIKELHKSHEEIKRKERNAKSRLKRAESKLD